MKGKIKPALLLVFLLPYVLYMYFSKPNLIHTTEDRDKDTSFIYGNWPRPRPVFSESKKEQQHGFIEKAETVEYKNSIGLPAEPGRSMVTEYEDVDNFIENVGLLINESRQEPSSLSMFVQNQDEHLQNAIQITKEENEVISRTINKYTDHDDDDDDDLKYEDEIKDVRRENIPDVLTWNERNISKTIETLAGGLLDVIPSSFEKNIRNPCWYDDRGLRCLPYFYLAGMPKSGTTDVWEKISAHPDVVSCRKELHWWTRTRFVENKENNFNKYLARQRPLAERLTNSEAQSKTAIIGDGSASIFWDFRFWSTLFPTESEAPRETNAHLIHTIQPDARIIVILRNPTDRLYSDYYYFNYGKLGKHVSPTMFHRCSIEAIEIFNRCLQDHDLRTCTYSIIYKYYRPTKETDISLNVDRETTKTECPKLINRIVIGLYDVFAQDWLSVFPRDQLFFMRTKDWNSDCVEYLQQIYMFLGLDKQSDDERRKVCQTKHAKVDMKKPPILDESRKLLDEFYRPHMRRLSNLLNDTKYSWNL